MTDVRTLLADAVRTGWPARERKDAKRIRELEAELLDQKKGYDELWLKNRKAEARAEKAEALIEELRFTLEEGSDYLRVVEQQKSIAEARVAELEDALKACIDETPAMWVREKEED